MAQIQIPTEESRSIVKITVVQALTKIWNGVLGLLAGKQNTLVAGSNITIHNGIISASQPDVSNLATRSEVNNGLAGKQNTLVAGQGINIEGNTISVDGNAVTPTSIDMSANTDLDAEQLSEILYDISVSDRYIKFDYANESVQAYRCPKRDGTRNAETNAQVLCFCTLEGELFYVAYSGENGAWSDAANSTNTINVFSHVFADKNLKNHVSEISGGTEGFVTKGDLIQFEIVVYYGTIGLGPLEEESFSCFAEKNMTFSDYYQSKYLNSALDDFLTTCPKDYELFATDGSLEREDIEQVTNYGTKAIGLETILEDEYTYYYYNYVTCLLGDTEITMYDGTTKQIQDIQVGDKVLSLDLETGLFVERSVIFSDAGQNKKAARWDEWIFDDGTIIKTAHRHEFYNVEKGRFAYLDEWTIGQHTYKQDGTTPALIDHIQHEEIVNHYKITLEGSNNYFANGLLTGDRNCNKEKINIQ